MENSDVNISYNSFCRPRPFWVTHQNKRVWQRNLSFCMRTSFCDKCSFMNLYCCIWFSTLKTCRLNLKICLLKQLFHLILLVENSDVNISYNSFCRPRPFWVTHQNKRVWQRNLSFLAPSHFDLYSATESLRLYRLGIVHTCKKCFGYCMKMFSLSRVSMLF
jgi:hypothetical protein